MRIGNCLLAVLGVLFLVNPAGCNKAKEKLAEKAIEKAAEKQIEAASGGKADVDISSGKMTIKTGEGTFSYDTAGGSVPESFPKDVPLPKPAKVITSMAGNENITLLIESPKSVGDLEKEFSAGMKDNGWEKTLSMDAEKSSVRGFKKDKREASIAMEGGKDKTTVTIVINL